MSLDISPHYPVMLNEVIDLIQNSKKNTIVDCTFGCGGYSKKILELFPQFKIMIYIFLYIISIVKLF